MRIISQDGMIDIPYNQVLILRDATSKIFARFYEECSHITIAEYSTNAKAKKAMEMLRKAYQYAQECKFAGVGASQPSFYFQFPTDDEIENLEEEI